MSFTILLFLFCINTLYLTCSYANDQQVSKQIYTNLTHDEEVTETHDTICKITTEEIVASARATVTRVLNGACTPSTYNTNTGLVNIFNYKSKALNKLLIPLKQFPEIIDEKLQSLEQRLTKKLEEIQNTLFTLLDSKTQPTRIGRTYDDYREDKSGTISPRQPEIDKFNNTIQRVTSAANDTSTCFFYYWKIQKFDEKLTSWRTTRSIRSSTFYVGRNGYGMYIKITPRYFPDGTVFIGVGPTRTRHDSTLRWPFPHKIRLEVLDHSFEQPRQDRRSRIWDPATLCSEYFWGRPKSNGEPDNPECVGLSVPRLILYAKLPISDYYPPRTTRYLWNGSIIIKLIVYV